LFIDKIKAMSKVVYITEYGLQKLKADLEKLKSERPLISAQIAEARDKGDLSENAEYDAAKEAQGLLEMRIAKLEETIAKARVMDESKIDISQVQILTRVKLKNVGTKAIMEYQIVAESEANFKEGRLSVGTPIAQALLGRKVGEIVDVKIPSGTIKLEILDITL
jgi:transcription elongation factor GreA